MEHEAYGVYEKYIKRPLDLVLSLLAVIILSPLLLVLMILGSIFMRGNPFFVQERPGKDEKIFKLIKFRTMDNRKDTEGKLLPDEVRLNRYGRFLRSTSLDELPELFNIIKGDMAIVGPRPLLVKYLPYYTKEERHRHDVRPGLTGLAQVNGRNYVKWDIRLSYDVQYVMCITFCNDVSIIKSTIQLVLRKQDIAVNSNDVESNLAEERQQRMQMELN